MQILLNGLVQGGLFALMGVAFALVYNTTRVFHVALGGIYALAPFVLLATSNAGMHWVVGVFAALVICGLVALLCEETLHWPFLRKSAPPEVHLIGSLGMFLVIIQIIALLWGNETQVLRAGIDEVYTFADMRLASAQALALVTAVIVLGLFFWGLKKSSLGLQLRAMADNPILLSLLGRNVRRLRRLVFVLSAVMATTAALASAYDVGFDPHGGLRAVLAGMVATIIGGRGSFIGAAIAGFLLGVIRSQVVWYASARWEEAATFLILALILFFRPQGLLGRSLRMEEKV
jgi:branched-chain amino acid transport system permease protein